MSKFKSEFKQTIIIIIIYINVRKKLIQIQISDVNS